MAEVKFDPRAPRLTRLSGVELRNFKSVRAIEVALGPLTVIAGANSAGKSTLIQAVLALTQVSRRRIDGRRFPLNDELARLGSFVSLRHQGSGADEAVVLGGKFVSDERDVRRNTEMRSHFGGPTFEPERSREALPVDVQWVVELDSAVEDQVGSAQISALEVSLTGQGLEFSSRIERTAEPSAIRSQRDEIDDARTFSGTVRSGSSATPVLDAFISSGQALSFFGIPPEAPIRVRDWFLSIQDQELETEEPARDATDRDLGANALVAARREELEQLRKQLKSAVEAAGRAERQVARESARGGGKRAADRAAAANLEVERLRLDLELAERQLAVASADARREEEVRATRAVMEAAWAVGADVSPSADFVEWYRSLDQQDQEALELQVLTAFEADRKRSTSSRGGIERLEGRAPSWLGGAQRACARYLASQVRYVGPLRQAPHQPFGTAPDPDSGDVGVAGQYVAAVLQANRSLKRRFPLPPSPVPYRADAATLEEAVNAWLAFLDLATSLTVREDTPLVLGIDVVPPGLEHEVSLGAVGVGVSQVLPIIVQCLVAGPGALVILEQPELHLHPAAQQRLADFLLACTRWGQNLLVESHSEYLVLRLRRRIAENHSDSIRSQVTILFAERDAAGATSYKDVELTSTGGVVEWPQGFFDQGPDEAHQLLIAAAERQRAQGGDGDAK